MLEVTCIEKYRNKDGVISSYVIKYLNSAMANKTRVVSKDDLKKAIKENKVVVNNLTLTSDNRLVEHKQREIVYPKESKNAFYRVNKSIKICHGSCDIIEKPIFGKGEKTNDYGLGFYTVFEREIELAREWACSMYNDTGRGYVNKYEFNTDGIRVLDFDKMGIIYWITLTASNRKVNASESDLKLLQSKYLIDTSLYDCICGWRCDDTFSKILLSFLNGNCTDKAIEEATRLGHLKQQFVLMSKKAFDNVHNHEYEAVKDFNKYRKRFDTRKADSDNGLIDCIRRNRNNGKYIDDYIKEIKNGN